MRVSLFPWGLVGCSRRAKTSRMRNFGSSSTPEGQVAAARGPAGSTGCQPLAPQARQDASATPPGSRESFAFSISAWGHDMGPLLCPGDGVGAGSASETRLGVEAATAEAPFQDHVSGKTGTGCQATATGTGLDFDDFWSVVEDLKGMLAAHGWQEDIRYMADGPTGTGGGFHKDSGLCLLMVGWEPSEDANCPSDEPIGLCELSPEQKLYTIMLNCAEVEP